MLKKHVSGYTQSQYHCAEGCTAIDLKDDTVVEHPYRPLCSVSLHTVYPAGWLLPQTPDQCGTLRNSLSCRKATARCRYQVSAQCWPHGHVWGVCGQKIKVCWGSTCVCVCVCVCVCCKFVSDKCCFITGRENSKGSLTLDRGSSLFKGLLDGIWVVGVSLGR